MSNKNAILAMRDKSDKYNIKKENVPDLIFKIGICGRSMISGKTTLAANIILQPYFYGNLFLGDDIYI